MKRILIVEDESRIAAFLDKGLRRSGFVTEVATDGRTAHVLAGSGRFDLVILDLGLPELDGFTVLRRLRSEHVEVPVIILTARDGVSDTVAGLEGGPDDYVRKPFAFDELLARIRLRLRSSGRPEETMLRSGSLSLDLRTRRAVVDGSPVELTAREFGLLGTFLDHPDQVLTREQLLSGSGDSTSTPGPMSSMSTCATCDARSETTGSRRSGESGIGSCLTPDLPPPMRVLSSCVHDGSTVGRESGMTRQRSDHDCHDHRHQHRPRRHHHSRGGPLSPPPPPA